MATIPLAADILQTSPHVLLLLAVLTLAAVLLVRLVRAYYGTDPREPPPVYPRIPLVGHILGIARYHHGYQDLLHARHGWPSAVSLPILSGRLYGIYTPGLAKAVVASRSLSFEPYISDFVRRMTSASAETMRVFDSEAFRTDWIKTFYQSLTGPELLRINRVAVDVELNVLNETVPRGKEGLAVDNLWDWVADIVTLATTTALFGKRNPWAMDRGLVADYWYACLRLVCIVVLLADGQPAHAVSRNYESKLLRFMITPLPWFPVWDRLTGVRVPYLARCRMEEALARYVGDCDDALPGTSRFVHERMELLRAHGIPAREAANLEVAVVHGSLSNTMPTAFWMLALIFGCGPAAGDGDGDEKQQWYGSEADREWLVRQLRAEAEAVVTVQEEETLEPDKGGGNRRSARRVATIHLANLESACPILASALREVQRIAYKGALNRVVIADTTLADPETGESWLLKKGMHAIVSQSVQGLERDYWGDDVHLFRGARFWSAEPPAADAAVDSRRDADVKIPTKSDSSRPSATTTTTTTTNGKAINNSDNKKGYLLLPPNPNAFFPFGGGKHICPGRHFATAEIEGLVVALVLGFEIRDADGVSPYRIPRRTEPVINHGIGKPAPGESLRCRFVRREGWEDIVWKVDL